MISRDEILTIRCQCGSCSDCSTSEFDEFKFLIEDNGEDFVNRERQQLIEGARLRHKARFPVGAEDIVGLGTYEDRASELSQHRIDFHCLRVQAIIADVPEETPWIGFVLHGLANRHVHRAPEPYKPRRRRRSTPPFLWSSSLFGWSEVSELPRWHKGSKHQVRK